MSKDLIKDGIAFMTAADQTTDVFNYPQMLLYQKLIDEEVEELRDAIDQLKVVLMHQDCYAAQPEDVFDTKVDIHIDIVDAFCDILVVTLHGLLSMGVDPQQAWDTVFKHNMAKFKGELVKNADGKVVKSPEWKVQNAKEQHDELKALVEPSLKKVL